LTLSETTLAIDEEEKIPKDHRFDVQAVNRQTLGVFSQNCKKLSTSFDLDFDCNASLPADSDKNDSKLVMEGTIVEKLECRPYADQTYMNMKAKAMVIAAQPKRKVEQLDTVVSNFKPISDHKHNVSLRSWKFFS
jgi:transcription initiation factor TFIIF subunit beta